jgi:hypothetical protein
MLRAQTNASANGLNLWYLCISGPQVQSGTSCRQVGIEGKVAEAAR